ncbi:uncharacterized protein [Temnothorax longispinosus]|uniref:uncharacterized protein isoform X2 n=1 Tax=Temnothorax longispinosus TaxID=300112 RepID=UPI003A992FF0
MGSRFSQDCLENVFRIVRQKHPTPNSIQFKNDLKLITISQYMANVSHGNYEEDDRTFLSEFLEILEKRNTKKTRTNDEKKEEEEDGNKENNCDIINNNNINGKIITRTQKYPKNV